MTSRLLISFCTLFCRLVVVVLFYFFSVLDILTFWEVGDQLGLRKFERRPAHVGRFVRKALLRNKPFLVLGKIFPYVKMV